MTNTEMETVSEITPEPKKKILKIIIWIFYGIFCLLLFTFWKLPEDRIKGLIDSNLSALLSEKGIKYTSKDSHLSLFTGIKYTLKDVTLTFPPPAPPAHLDQIQITPALFSMLFGKLGGNLWTKQGEGELSLNFSIKNTTLSLNLQSKKMDLGKTGLFPILTTLQGSAILDGYGSMTGDLSLPSSLEGTINFQFKKIGIDPQSVMIFAVPRLQVSEGTINLEVEKSKIAIRSFKLGKGSDKVTDEDVAGTITGDITLGKQWENSTLNLKTRFRLSDNVTRAFVLLDSILTGSKQADGSYSYSLSGPISSPIPMPGG
jgi:type II secretion system protein N